MPLNEQTKTPEWIERENVELRGALASAAKELEGMRTLLAEVLSAFGVVIAMKFNRSLAINKAVLNKVMDDPKATIQIGETADGSARVYTVPRTHGSVYDDMLTLDIKDVSALTVNKDC